MVNELSFSDELGETKIIEASPTEVLGASTWNVDSEDVLITGTFLIFCASFLILDRNQPVTRATMVSPLPRWFRVLLGPSQTIRLRVLSRGVVAPLSGDIISGADIATAYRRRAPIATSLPLAMTYLDAALAPNPVIGRTAYALPGSLHNVGQKLSSVAGAAGFTAILSDIAPTKRSAFLILRCTPPQGETTTSSNNQRLDTLQIAVRTEEFGSVGGIAGTGFPQNSIFLTTDIAPHVVGHATITLAMAVDAPVNAVGYFFPSVEQGTDRVNLDRFWRIDLIWRRLGTLRYLPMQGMSGGLPGLGFGGLSGSSASIASGGSGGYTIAL